MWNHYPLKLLPLCAILAPKNGFEYGTQKIYCKRYGLRIHTFWLLFRFWIVKWVLHWYLPLLKIIPRIIVRGSCS